jgi:DNA-binding CsgD family transcriptional regulator
MIAISDTKPVWTPETALSKNFCKHYQLTNREKDIVEVMINGKSNKEIANTLFISIRTVGAYLQNVYKNRRTEPLRPLLTDKWQIIPL